MLGCCVRHSIAIHQSGDKDFGGADGTDGRLTWLNHMISWVTSCVLILLSLVPEPHGDQVTENCNSSLLNLIFTPKQEAPNYGGCQGINNENVSTSFNEWN